MTRDKTPRRKAAPKVPTYTHHLIAKTAMGIAAAAYESMAHDNVFYKLHPSQKGFVETYWSGFLRQAKTQLAGMLRGDYPDSLKAEIMDALTKDKSIPASMRATKRSAKIYVN